MDSSTSTSQETSVAPVGLLGTRLQETVENTGPVKLGATAGNTGPVATAGNTGPVELGATAGNTGLVQLGATDKTSENTGVAPVIKTRKRRTMSQKLQDDLSCYFNNPQKIKECTPHLQTKQVRCIIQSMLHYNIIDIAAHV